MCHKHKVHRMQTSELERTRLANNGIATSRLCVAFCAPCAVVCCRSSAPLTDATQRQTQQLRRNQDAHATGGLALHAAPAQIRLVSSWWMARRSNRDLFCICHRTGVRPRQLAKCWQLLCCSGPTRNKNTDRCHRPLARGRVRKNGHRQHGDSWSIGSDVISQLSVCGIVSRWLHWRLRAAFARWHDTGERDKVLSDCNKQRNGGRPKAEVKQKEIKPRWWPTLSPNGNPLFSCRWRAAWSRGAPETKLPSTARAKQRQTPDGQTPISSHSAVFLQVHLYGLAHIKRATTFFYTDESLLQMNSDQGVTLNNQRTTLFP